MSDPYIAALAAKERAKGFAHVRLINDEWRREGGLPRRQLEVAREVTVQFRASVAGFKEQMAKVAAVFNPGAPDGFNNWEPAPPVAHPSEPTPIYAAVVREWSAR